MPNASANLPLVSIIMPAYNAARFIGKAIASVVEQTYTNWELWVVDDASSDNTAEVVAGFNDPRIRYHRVERIGSPSGVRNVGLRLAQGEFIGFLDADDYFCPNMLGRLAAVLLDNPQATAVYGFSFGIDEDENPLPEWNHLLPSANGGYRLPPSYNHSWENIVLGMISCLLAGLMLRRSTLERVGMFNEDLSSAEDYEFYVRLFLDNIDGVHCLPEYVYNYRIYSTSLTKAPEHYEHILQSSLRIQDWLFNRANIPAEVMGLKSKAYVGCYRYYARERLLNHQPVLCRKLAFSALKDPNTHLGDWFQKCLPLILRSYLPTSMNITLVSLRKALVTRFQRSLH